MFFILSVNCGYSIALTIYVKCLYNCINEMQVLVIHIFFSILYAIRYSFCRNNCEDLIEQT